MASREDPPKFKERDGKPLAPITGKPDEWASYDKNMALLRKAHDKHRIAGGVEMTTTEIVQFMRDTQRLVAYLTDKASDGKGIVTIPIKELEDYVYPIGFSFHVDPVTLDVTVTVLRGD